MLAMNAATEDIVGDSDLWVATLKRQGYCIIPNVVARSLVEALHNDLRERFRETPYCEGDFYGRVTKRFGALLKRSRHSEAFVRHPLMLAIAQAILGPYCDCLQLNLTQGIELHPGAEEQPAHRDQDMWRGPKGEVEYLLNIMWPLSPFSPENGATVIWPASHLDQQNYFLSRDTAVAAEMEPGSALAFLGSTLHAGGANHSPAPRTGMIVSYCLGWLKPFENQWLVYPPEIARNFSPELARLVGYAVHRPNLGNYEGQCPSVLLRGVPNEYLPAVDALPPEHLDFISQLRQR